jgi:hypothetical protein
LKPQTGALAFCCPISASRRVKSRAEHLRDFGILVAKPDSGACSGAAGMPVPERARPVTSSVFHRGTLASAGRNDTGDDVLVEDGAWVEFIAAKPIVL